MAAQLCWQLLGQKTTNERVVKQEAAKRLELPQNIRKGTVRHGSFMLWLKLSPLCRMKGGAQLGSNLQQFVSKALPLGW